MRSWISLITLIMLLVWAMPVHAFMLSVSDEELSEITGEGFSSFELINVNNNIDLARIDFNITTSTYTQIDSLKMGYYDNGSGLGWDQDWTDVSLGSPTEDLVCKGIYFEARFMNIADSAARRLEYVKIGSPDMTGPITATFNSFSGTIENPTDGVLVDGTRLNLGTRTVYSNHGEFSVTLQRDAGWSVQWKNATITP